MGSAIVLAILSTLLLVVGAILGWVAFYRTRHLDARIATLETELQRLRHAPVAPRKKEERKQEQSSAEDMSAPYTSKEARRPSEPKTKDTPAPTVKPLEPAASQTPPFEDSAPRSSWMGNFLQQARKQWMVWLGGIWIGLAGIFLVRYSIEAGVLGPKQRIILAILSGIGLHLAAEWFRRRTGSEGNPVFAAMAGGASIILFAAILAALHLYSFLTPSPLLSINSSTGVISTKADIDREDSDTYTVTVVATDLDPLVTSRRTASVEATITSESGS